ncbi:MAG: hypothetical protein K2L70_01610 [Clostridia bacterium]|nr:hypothetical protein [Clostridia bacterium]
MKNKKIIVAIFVISVMLIGVFSFVACNNTPSEGNNSPSGDGITSGNGETTQVSYTIVAPDGAPALSIANLASRISTEGKQYAVNRKVVASSTISAEAVKNDVDMAIVPANLAAKIFNTGGGYKMLAVVTNGNLYVTSSISSNVESLQDLKGKMVYSIGQSSVPDMIFQTLLKKADIPYEVGETPSSGKVTIKYCLDGSEVISQLALAKAKGQLAFGIYAEPAVTNSKAKGFEEVFDLQSLWAQSGDDSQNGYAQAVLIARDRVCEDSEFVAKLLDSFVANESAILKDSAKAVENIKAIYPQSALQANMTSQVIGRCNIKTVKADALGRNYYENTLKAVMAINANLIGGQLPSDDFYIA